MDRESLRRERARQNYEQLRARPRPKNDASSLRAIFSKGNQTLAQGTHAFISLLKEIRGQNTFVEEWRDVRTPEDHERATGLNPLTDEEAYIRYLRDENEATGFTFSILAFSRKIYPHDPRTYSALLTYRGGKAPYPTFDSLFFGCNEPEGERDHNLTLQEYLTMIRTIVEWREPRMVSVGNSYETYDRVFWNRAWDGWIGWFPQEIDPRVLPDFALTWRIGNGTAVATQETNVLSRFPDQKEKANELEVALVEAGILPTETELKGDR